ncbi:MAG: protecting protein DprA protein [Candidatus Magasanikbacteria bacterium GW2011_GWC2_37_14]|uniref:Protecting protein DprA protein n=1 Tax=Candidatus Magasanikbacteria bacterium GW2011_GWC2_37_14 TaxID=1619046 RepID=A0A0G0ISP4_9BACT|nr:MAG: protecting protein DprA protein [Candidatus Magasanikbacteria bacterium GW2011_GWC2_37_14]
MKKEILLSYFPKITSKRYQNLIAVFDNLDNAWQASANDLIKMGWEEKLVSEFINWKNNLDEEKIAKILKHENIYCLTKEDQDYPRLLKEIYDPPFCLFVKGKLNNTGYNLAVVGTRKYSTYGKQITEELTHELVNHGLTIVSGLALGIDGIAHDTCLKAGGQTIAVLGSGINNAHIFPKQHLNLSKRIVEAGGAIISEYPPGTIPTHYTFPRRNRIVAGMSLGTLVIEAPESSGALITAQCSLDNNREVFAVPQNINTMNSAGGNNLLKTGAHLITKAQDILEILELDSLNDIIVNREIIPETENEAKILKILSREPINIEQIIKNSDLDSATTNATLTLMEMKGKVKNLGGMMYVLGSGK